MKKILAMALVMGVGWVISWWWQPVTAPAEPGKVELPQSMPVTATTVPLQDKPLPTQPIPMKLPTLLTSDLAADVDYFETSLLLHKNALAGDPVSQLALGRILDLCAKVADERAILQHNLQQLYAYSSQLPAHVLPELEFLLQACINFHPENLQVFFPQNEFDQRLFDSSHGAVIWHDLPMYWKTAAAAAGNEQALIDIVAPVALPGAMLNIDHADVREVLLAQLTKANPALLFRVSNCLPPEQEPLRLALMKMACGQTAACRGLPQYHEILLLQLRQISEHQPESDSLGRFEQNLGYLDFPTLLNKVAPAEMNSSIDQQQLQHNLQDRQFSADLIEQCAQYMRPPGR